MENKKITHKHKSWTALFYKLFVSIVALICSSTSLIALSGYFLIMTFVSDDPIYLIKMFVALFFTVLMLMLEALLEIKDVLKKASDNARY